MRPTAPIRQPIKRKCPSCGGKFENPSTTNRVCYSCHLDRQTPKNFMERERYQFAAGIQVATTKPKTGIPLLDQKNFNLWEIIVSRDWIRHKRKIEQAMGLDSREYYHKKFTEK